MPPNALSAMAQVRALASRQLVAAELQDGCSEHSVMEASCAVGGRDAGIRSGIGSQGQNSGCKPVSKVHDCAAPWMCDHCIRPTP